MSLNEGAGAEGDSVAFEIEIGADPLPKPRAMPIRRLSSFAPGAFRFSVVPVVRLLLPAVVETAGGTPVAAVAC